jgi:hypothetical protein
MDSGSYEVDLMPDIFRELSESRARNYLEQLN